MKKKLLIIFGILAAILASVITYLLATPANCYNDYNCDAGKVCVDNQCIDK